MEKDESVNVELRQIELQKIDLTKYVGRKTRIGNVETIKGEYGYYLKLTSTIVDLMDFGKEQRELKATRLFSLYTDKNGVIGWGSDTLLGNFLKQKNVQSPDELLGREVIVQLQNKNGKDFLTFI